MQFFIQYRQCIFTYQSFYFMFLREATPADIPQLSLIRLAVQENRLSNPGLVTEQDYHEYLTTRGKGWAALVDDQVVGFAIVDCIDHNVWALFMQPGFEGRGIGKKLHDQMLDWYFSQTDAAIWLGTAPGTRAEHFYRAAGWEDKGLRPNGERKFEMMAGQWKNRELTGSE